MTLIRKIIGKKKIIILCDNDYELRQFYDRVKRAEPIITNCRNNPKLGVK